VVLPTFDAPIRDILEHLFLIFQLFTLESRPASPGDLLWSGRGESSDAKSAIDLDGVFGARDDGSNPGGPKNTVEVGGF
jgi:hypothetical protein